MKFKMNDITYVIKELSQKSSIQKSILLNETYVNK